MRIEAIRDFVVLAEVGSFNRASEKLFISPQGLNQEITKLEAQLDMPLLSRNGRQGIALTEQGELFLEQAKGLLVHYDGIIDTLMASAAASSSMIPGSGHLEIVATYHMVHALMLGRRRAMLPHIVRITEKELNQIIAMAEEGEPGRLFLVDLYATGERELAEHPSLYFEEFYQDTMGVLWKEGVTQPLPSVVTREQVCNLPLVMSNYKGTRVWLEWVFRDHPFTNVVTRGTPPAYLFHMAQEGLYVMFDADGFRLGMQNPTSATDGLRFSILDTSEATMKIGLIHKQGVQESELQKTYGEVIHRILMRDL